MNIGVDPIVLEQNLGTLATIVEDFGIAIGVVLIFAAFLKFKRHGEMRGGASHQSTLAGPIMLLMSGVALLWLPTVVGVALQAFWGANNPMSLPTTGDSGLAALEPAILMFVRLVGVIAFIRGWILLSKTGKEGAQPGTLGKGLTHLLGGILCIHIIGTMDLLAQILGFID